MMDDRSVTQDRQKIISILTAARLEKGISQQALAEMIGTKRSNISRMESGAHNISLDMLLKVAGALGKDVSVVLEERENGIMDEYSLRLYDEELLTFRLKDSGLEGLKAEILSVNDLPAIKFETLAIDFIPLHGNGDRCRRSRLLPYLHGHKGAIP